MIKDGIIYKGIGGFYYVKAEDNTYECKARGKFRNQDIIPMIGDKVKIEIIDEKQCKGSIEKIFPRSSLLIRPPVSNVNQVVIVMSSVLPQPNLFFIDKLIVCSSVQNLDIIICINKIDLDKEKKYENIVNLYKNAGYKVVCTSCETNEGIDRLKKNLGGKITVFAGASGVGKSSLLNRINPKLVLETGMISKKIQRGRHTTRHVELFEIDSDGFVVDTPGFSSIDIEGINKNELFLHFNEFTKIDENCRFRGCSHIAEPGCAIIAGVNSGIISQSRYNSYKQMYEILKEKKEW